jgi:hypothetical protein
MFIFRLTTLLSLLYLTWFITSHILTYTSVHTCRLTSPHLWWLTFGIICIDYLVIVGVVVIAFLVLIVGPLILVCLISLDSARYLFDDLQGFPQHHPDLHGTSSIYSHNS